MHAFVVNGMPFVRAWTIVVRHNRLQVNCPLVLGYVSTFCPDLGLRKSFIIECDANDAITIIEPQQGEICVTEDLFEEHLSFFALLISTFSTRARHERDRDLLHRKSDDA